MKRRQKYNARKTVVDGAGKLTAPKSRKIWARTDTWQPITREEALALRKAAKSKSVAACFDSGDEFRRWHELLLLQRAGKIQRLERQQVIQIFAYGQHMLHKRRLDPENDLMSAIARAQVDGQLLSDEYLDGSWLLIIFAGNDTTRNTLSGAMKLLTEFPDQKAKLIARPDLLANAADEFIRLVSPVIYMRRTALQDAEIADQKIAAGEKVIMYYGAANRDPAMFDNPDQLDVSRENANKHIAFGYGPHVCLGKRVAQIQLEEAFRQILGRFPDIEWTGEIDIAPNNFVHAIRKLGVRYAPRN